MFRIVVLWRSESFFVKTLRFKCVSAQYSSRTENMGAKIKIKQKQHENIGRRKIIERGSLRDCAGGKIKSLGVKRALLSPRSVIQRSLVPSISLVLETELEQRVMCVSVCVCDVCRAPCDPSVHTYTNADTHSLTPSAGESMQVLLSAASSSDWCKGTRNMYNVEHSTQKHWRFAVRERMHRFRGLASPLLCIKTLVINSNNQ